MLFFIVTFHQIVFYSLCFGRSWLLIHLMLKLIAVGVALGGLAARFNTSHVKVKRTNNIIKPPDPVSFNTSHVKVNQRGWVCSWTRICVSIHPMLKLIKYAGSDHSVSQRFNTSHVKVNRFTAVWRIYSHCVSIHPMLKLI